MTIPGSEAPSGPGIAGNSVGDALPSLAGSFLKAFVYPLRSLGGWAFLFSGTAILTLTNSLRTGLHRDASPYLLVLSALLIAGYLYQIVEETVGGNKRPPSLHPEGWEDSVAFLPVLLLFFYAMSEQKGHLDEPRFQILLAALLFLGTLYFPMALLLNGFSQRFATAFNLSVGFRGIRTMGGDYALCSGFFLLAHGTWILLEIWWVGATPRGLNGARMETSAITSFVGLYLSVVQMRALGLLYRKHQERLGWSLGPDA